MGYPERCPVPTGPTLMIDLVAAIVDQWNRTGVNYSVANGLEGYPDRLGRDIDIVVAEPDLQAASATVEDVLGRSGWRVVVQKYGGELVQHFAIAPSGEESLIVDLFAGLRWGPVWLVREPDASRDRHGFQVDPWVTFVKRVLLHVLVSPGAKFGQRPDRLVMAPAERRAASTRLPTLIGGRLATRLIDAIEEKDLAALETLQPEIRKALVLSAMRAGPARALRTAVQWAVMRITFATAPALMPTVAIVAPPGIDRAVVVSEVARRAEERLGCPQVAIRQGPDVIRESAQHRRAVAGLRYAIAAIRGSFEDRRRAVDWGLTVHQRSPLDLYVEAARYGRTARWLSRALLRILPKPGLVVLLDGPPRCGNRSGLDPQELERQSRLWRDLAADGAIDLLLPAGRDPRLLAEDIVNRLIQLFVNRS